MKFLSLGIVAHVDAGKTSLTGRLLFDSGVLERMGRVDDGDTHTDSLALERERGITIRSAVVSFDVDDVTVNLLDTPGHPDFIAEVERVLGVLDAAVLVVTEPHRRAWSALLGARHHSGRAGARPATAPARPDRRRGCLLLAVRPLRTDIGGDAGAAVRGSRSARPPAPGSDFAPVRDVLGRAVASRTGAESESATPPRGIRRARWGVRRSRWRRRWPARRERRNPSPRPASGCRARPHPGRRGAGRPP